MSRSSIEDGKSATDNATTNAKSNCCTFCCHVQDLAVRVGVLYPCRCECVSGLVCDNVLFKCNNFNCNFPRAITGHRPSP